MDLQLSSVFIKNLIEVYPSQGANWIRDLPSVVTKLCLNWDITFLNTVPNLSFGYVAFVEHRKNKRPLVLKLTPAGGPTVLEAEWLSLFPANAPEILETNISHNAVLMERLSPGKSLKELVINNQDVRATEILAETIQNLQSISAQKKGFRHLSELAKDLHVLEGKFDAELVKKARELFDKLSTPQSTDILLHGDLHHDNVLSDGDSWKVIDPHGYVGDRVFEVAPMIYNPLDAFPHARSMQEIIRERMEILSNQLSFDFHRVRDWSFCMAMLSMAWTCEGSGKIPSHEAEVARVCSSL